MLCHWGLLNFINNGYCLRHHLLSFKTDFRNLCDHNHDKVKRFNECNCSIDFFNITLQKIRIEGRLFIRTKEFTESDRQVISHDRGFSS